MSKKALIVIDIQNDYFEDGAIELVNPIEASLNTGSWLGYIERYGRCENSNIHYFFCLLGCGSARSLSFRN